MILTRTEKLGALFFNVALRIVSCHTGYSFNVDWSPILRFIVLFYRCSFHHWGSQTSKCFSTVTTNAYPQRIEKQSRWKREINLLFIQNPHGRCSLLDGYVLKFTLLHGEIGIQYSISACPLTSLVGNSMTWKFSHSTIMFAISCYKQSEEIYMEIYEYVNFNLSYQPIKLMCFVYQRVVCLLVRQLCSLVIEYFKVRWLPCEILLSLKDITIFLFAHKQGDKNFASRKLQRPKPIFMRIYMHVSIILLSSKLKWIVRWTWIDIWIHILLP